MKRLTTSLPILIAFLLGLLIANVVTLVYAHGGDTNLIHGCVKNSNGSLRIVGVTDICNSNETEIDWRKAIAGEGTFPLVCPGVDCDLRLTGSRFTGRDLTGAFIPRADLGGLNLTSTKFINAFMQGLGANITNFTSVDFTNADLSPLDIGGVGVSASLIDANFTNANFTNTNLTGADFTNTIRTGIIWSNTICPDGTNSNNNDDTCEGHLNP